MSVKSVSEKCSALEERLKGKLFLGGVKPSEEDVKVFNDLLGVGNTCVYRWVKNMASFTESERQAWGPVVKVSPPPVKPTAPAATAAPAASKAPSKVAPTKKADDDDDIDLFGEATEEEKAALDAKKKKDAEAKSSKKVIIAKSSILFDIKPWDDTVDLKALAEKLHAIERDGLLWGDHKLVPVAFGVKKLQQLVVIEDDKISGDDLEEMIMSFEEDVQSMDIVAWNKI
ncbi:EF 1 guanine nucleotide exchange domain [Trypanosoma vivax]|uniref:Putative translation elongation factor 1-beta n=2 Tax=Trypanosoma vivax (strain Y486) TaxID=1055687 RepID=G0TUN6_TRYVY|nr:putative translation elongation factor 1-beta [Trypanosoma vivax]KAH8607146.1 EF 1 guanine nucleotide exchange domain [Trypanosoma vivax]KAH8607251.1 EF 1 guanine nucleotide exchange domain [Trypanosoma vivax]CCC47671.1 putative translation elongation factor 1-beta [Trypanosoma vivax Y486]